MDMFPCSLASEEVVLHVSSENVAEKWTKMDTWLKNSYILERYGTFYAQIQMWHFGVFTVILTHTIGEFHFLRK